MEAGGGIGGKIGHEALLVPGRGACSDGAARGAGADAEVAVQACWDGEIIK